MDGISAGINIIARDVSIRGMFIILGIVITVIILAIMFTRRPITDHITRHIDTGEAGRSSALT